MSILTINSIISQCYLNGFIKNADNQYLQGVSVRIKDSEFSAVTDSAGTYRFANLPSGDYVLLLNYIGMEESEIKINCKNINSLETTMRERNYYTSELSVIASRANYNDPFSYSNINKKDIEKNNLGVDMPYLLDQTASVVVNSDAGTGIGYTGIRIRGSDQTRINVTINGVPINDSESQGIWWVNMPDFASSTDNIQIQRGVGTSTNGAGAFGASINMKTNKVETEPFAIISNSYGSFNSRKHSLQLGSGLINNHFSFEGRLSQINSDGFIDRASSKLQSYYLSGSYSSDKTLIMANVFSGYERTYQSWGGVPQQYIDTNRTYNPYTYKNEVDNYNQTHYQLHWNQEINSNFSFNSALHYTKGAGYFEQFRTDDDLGNYNISSPDSNVTSSDLIRRRWLDNDFYGIVYGLHYNNNQLKISLGGAWNNYDGDHFGEVIWARFAGDSEIGHEYYRNNATKLDGSTYLKANWQLNQKFNLYADLQHRYLRYNFLGFNNNLENVTQTATLNFFNPKFGIVFFPSTQQKLFASFAIGQREPNRDDFTQSTPTTRPQSETLYDTELGYSLNLKNFVLEANYYFMYYRNQLVLNGQINDVGAYIRTNVPNSYRTGLEIQTNYQPVKNLNWAFNTTISQNKIINFTEYVDNWDDWSQEKIEHKNTDIAFSPSLIIGSELNYNVLNKTYNSGKIKKQLLSLAWISKYVGKQYIDNTQNDSRSLPHYWVNDLRIRYQLFSTILKELNLNFTLRNFTHALYSNNAWVYRFNSASYDPRNDDPYTSLDNGSYYNMIGLFPQAGINFMVGLDLKF